MFISFAGSRFPVACLSGSVSIGFPHACLSLRVVTGSDNSPNYWNNFTDPLFSMLKTKMLLEYDDSLGTTRSMELSIVQLIVFPPILANCGVSSFSTHMNIRVLSKVYEAIEPQAFRVIALLRTDRNHEQNSCLLVYLHCPRSRQVACGVFGPSQSIHCI